MRQFSEGLLDEAKILAHLDIAPGQTVLDAGCGNGYMARRFSMLVGRTGKVYALDPNEITHQSLIEKFQNTNVVVLNSDITRPTAIDGQSLDLTYLATVFHIFSDDQVAGFNNEMNRILKPGARLAVVNLKKKETPFGPPVSMRSSPAELIRKIALAPRELVDVNAHFYMQLFQRRPQPAPDTRPPGPDFSAGCETF